DREAATRELDALGPAALDALRQAAQAGDPETRRRAVALLDRIGERAAAARILAPTTVTFDYADKPLTEAVADLARRTGLHVTLHHDPAKFRGRTVTAATAGPTPVWQAVELFCRKADLHEWDGFTPLAGAPPPMQTIPPGAFQGQGQIFIRGRVGSRAVVPPGQVVLLDGPGAAVPESQAGSVRVRALPPGTPFALAELGTGEVAVPLQV